jgi:hypothetical protein
MADFYDEMRDVVREMLAPTSEGGLGQGTIELVRYIEGPAPTNSWDPPATPEREITVLDGASRGVGKELIGAPVETGGQIVASDLQVVVAPWGGAVDPADVLQIDGTPVTILSVRNVPAAGTVCAVKFVVRR